MYLDLLYTLVATYLCLLHTLVCYVPWPSPNLCLLRTLAFSITWSATYLGYTPYHGLLHTFFFSIPWSATYLGLLHTSWSTGYLELLRTWVYSILRSARYLDLLHTCAFYAVGTWICSLPGPAPYLGLLCTWACSVPGPCLGLLPAPLW